MLVKFYVKYRDDRRNCTIRSYQKLSHKIGTEDVPELLDTSLRSEKRFLLKGRGQGHKVNNNRIGPFMNTDLY